MKLKFFQKVALLSLVAATVVVAGCRKYLDQQPITAAGTATVFSDVPSAYQALAAVYSRLTGDQGYGIRLSLYYTVDTDESYGPSGSGNDNDRRDIARYQATPNNLQLERPFLQLFQGIELANIAIDNIPEMDQYNGGSDKEKAQLRRMHGEALTLRAQFYLEAIRNWGDLPAHFLPAYKQASTDPLPFQVNRDTLYDQLLKDLEVAATLVPWRNEVGTIGDAVDERITKGTVKGLRARIALYRGGYSLRRTGAGLGVMQRGSNHLAYYQIARQECLDIMNSGQHALAPSYKELWKDYVGAHAVSDPWGELMFQATGIGGGSTADTKLGYYNGPRMNNFGNSSINPLPTYFYAFDSTDLRRDVTIAAYNVNQNMTKQGLAITALNDGKYRRDWITNPSFGPENAGQYFGLKWQILRYSDVLLMFAEAENEISGPTAAAYEAVNMVRRRGYGKPVGSADPTVDLTTGLSKDLFFKAIVKERALELGNEGVRKYDLIRWNLLGERLAETKAELQLMADRAGKWADYPQYMFFYQNSLADDASLWLNSFYKPNDFTTAPAGTTRVNWVQGAIATTTLARYAVGFQSGRSELLPFHITTLTTNKNIVQNPGY